METEELDVAIEELENRLERLRALYEQYFLGIEKIEPAVARKDVDRRIWLLRREQIRNTAKRFKLQTIIQRYNTFQQYWGRICREIENGTYTRHLIRAERTVGAPELLTIAARKRLGRRRAAEHAAEPAPTPVAEAGRNFAAAAGNPGRNPLEEAKRAVDAVLGRDSAAAPPAGGPPALRRPAPLAASRPESPGFEKLDLEMDFLDGPAAPPPASPASPASERPRPAALAAARAAAAGKPVGMTRRAPAPPARPAAHPAAALPGKPPAPTAPGGPAAARAPAVPARPAPPAQPGGEDPRVQELHARLVEAKRRTNDTREVTVDGLQKSLQAAEDRLRKQHGDRKIDFDVVIKDGKAVVKPILR